MTLLAAQALSKSFGGVRALDGVSFSVAAGELVAMIGPNGAGKSTCFSIVGGQLAPDAGQVTLMGQDVTGRPAHRLFRAGLGRTFQIAATFASMTVAENVRVALYSRERRLSSLLGAFSPHSGEGRLLDEVGLAPLAGRMVGTLAYSDVKRVELAVALAGRPRLLLMDEPAAGMAAGERGRMMELTAGLARARGMGVLFTEHDIGMVFDHADRVLVLAGGRLIVEGPPERLAADPLVRSAYLGSKKAVSRRPGAG